MDVRLIALLLLLVSCVPSADVSRSGVANDDSTDTSSGSGSGNGPVAISEIGWNYLGTNSLSISIDSDNLNTAYLTGTDIQSFLSVNSNYANTNYCVAANYDLAGDIVELRARAVPISYYDFTKKETVRVFRVDFPDATNSSSFCSGTLFIQDSSGDYIADTSGALAPVFEAEDVCPDCTSPLTSLRVRVFKKESTIKQIAKTSLNFDSLVLKVDPNNNSTNNPTSCSTASCVSRGFNCCLDSQCVNEGSTRPSAFTPANRPLYDVAQEERIQNPLAYLAYPQLYYICGTTPSTTSGSSSGAGGGGVDHDDEFEQTKKDYFCLKSLQSQATLSTYHRELLNDFTWEESVDCKTDDDDINDPQYYRTVVKRLYDNCECGAGPGLEEKINACPAYEYKVVLGTETEPLRFQCDPPASSGTTPLPTQMTVSVSGRAAPHRFFDASGAERTLPLSDTSVTQEGAPFSYSDDESLFPVQANFSMNAILGQMSIALDKTQPAKTIDVALDEVYFISTTSGTYTPCPQCGDDNWEDTFKPYPTSNSGTGLQAFGHSTIRDDFDNNATGGNYEDTIFGRACWIPPTMIPFSQRSMTPASEQRKNRLKTQAAQFVNGYQRDWFGFNKGALIGSFDGVSWFAIGKGRIVKSSTKKLYLAINAPFADVANNSSLSVNVQAFDGTTQAAQVDYDPQFHQTHPLQNEAGNCQKYHMCSTDSDCIATLGWEYACADVKDTKTNWPDFDSNAVELGGTNLSPVPSIIDVLEQKAFPSSATKRCVYRGAGSLCLRNAATVTDLNRKKTVTCAPNFYCASLSSTSFNGTVARSAANVDDLPISRNHLIGRDANVLGRPLNYLSGSTSVSLSEVSQTLMENMALRLPSQESLATASNTGLCLPGKALPTSASDQVTMANPFNQHLSADASKRTDYISQVGSCNSVLFTSYRHSSCPVIGTDGNYQMFAATTISDTLAYSRMASYQNACGLETLRTGTTLSGTADSIASNGSPFNVIEGKVLPNQIINDPTLARDACLRRAGAVCHTDLDCSPNKFHSDQEDIFSLSFFGNQAEKDYYDQFLVCGQVDPKPNSQDANFRTYEMNKNRCCREIGSDVTTYTPDTPTSVLTSSYDTTTSGLKMALAPGITPNDPKRYSRFATVENLGSTERPLLSAFQDRDLAGDLTTSTFGVNVRTAKQWKTINEANSETCCGGGWIRKFANGQTWEDRNRLNIEVENFRCLNSRTALITTPEDMTYAYDNVNPSPLVDADFGDYCKDGTNTKGSCAQYAFRDSLTDTSPVSNPYSSSVVINTLSPIFASGNLDFFFAPRSADTDSATFVDFSNASGRRNIAIKIPSYVPKSFDLTNINSLPVTRILSTGATAACTYDPTLDDPIASPTTVVACGTCCYGFDPSTRILRAAFGGLTTERAGIVITAPAAGSAAASTSGDFINRFQPGTNSYYLRRLGRLELSGIPQIAFEPLYCSDNHDRLIPGIFTASIDTRTEFESRDFSFRSGGINYTSSKGLQTEQIFSENEFKCCSPLGKTVTSSTRCCSGFVTTAGGASTCALPPGTDLMVYLNRYISNEGVGADKPGGGLVETDFDQLTGEPLLTTAINGKIAEFGRAFCSSKKIRQGAAFGSFEPQPSGSDTTLSSRVYGIVDSSNDNGQTSNAGTTVATGYTQFKEFGFRWNHHLYCED